eukprot:CAMPEP_0117667162 /NCGR_PEP_ID=MMETSP0804-20121206/10800_1 /TAXON_ID=1074897 /ORGANISM="Tetraselmis astigmatica, Strain CCMP880" /LENGTH=385 /DNA_ID=CAMNT_0005474831 /DNA_START=6 /DNA_END=1160 /DNA_ORIENTATION=-
MTKRALLCGCNYPGSSAALNGCVNDVNRMENFGFSDADIEVLIDTDSSYTSPTGGNIRRKLTEKVNVSEPGDVLVFHFSGHGSQVPSRTGQEHDGKDECICPTDMNVILDDDLRRILTPLKDGVNFTMIADCCHSGTMLDHTEVQIEGNKDPNAADMPDLGSLAAMFGLKDIQGGNRGLEIKNRSLPTETLFQLLGQSSGGKVDATNIHSTITNLFGADASPMIQQIATIALPMLMESLSGAGQSSGGSGGGGGGSAGAMSSCLPMLMGMLCGGGGSSGGSGNASGGAAGGGAGQAYQVPNVPLPGQKPPASEQLADDKGILITGCQSHETSADACPSADKSQAYGALSNAIQTVVKTHMANNPGQPLIYRDLVLIVRKTLLQAG